MRLVFVTTPRVRLASGVRLASVAKTKVRLVILDDRKEELPVISAGVAFNHTGQRLALPGTERGLDVLKVNLMNTKGG